MRHYTLLGVAMLGATLAPSLVAAEPIQLAPRGPGVIPEQTLNAVLPAEEAPPLDLRPDEDPFATEPSSLLDATPLELNMDLYHDLQVTITGLYVAAFAGLDMPEREPGPPLPSSGINGMDRDVVGNRSALAATLSDGFLAASMTLPFLAAAIDNLGGSGGWSGFGEDSLLLLETMAVASIATNITKAAVRRPRPYLYDPSSSIEDRAKGDASMSFYSGHTALAFAMATSYSYLFSLRNPDSKAKIPIWLTSHALAAGTAVMRVQGGKHFWSDVMTGAAIGSAIGFMVPYLHKSGGWKRLVGEDRFFSDLRVTPVSYPEGGWGVNAMLFW